MGITCFPLPRNNRNLTSPIFGGNYPILLLNNIFNDCICILTGSPVNYLFVIIFIIQKTGDNNNSPDSLNVMVNYQYHN